MAFGHSCHCFANYSDAVSVAACSGLQQSQPAPWQQSLLEQAGQQLPVHEQSTLAVASLAAASISAIFCSLQQPAELEQPVELHESLALLQLVALLDATFEYAVYPPTDANNPATHTNNNLVFNMFVNFPLK
jgi:hypothetical protein